MFNFLSDQTFANIEKYVETKRIRKGDFLFQQDEVCKMIFGIKKGICRKYFLHDGKEITTEFLFEDNFVISAKSFVLLQPANEFAQALTDLEVATLKKADFENLKQLYPELNALDQKLIEMHVIWLEERLFNFHTQDATTRYLHLIKSDPHYIKQIPLTYIASYLGISLETLSRIRAKVAKDII